MALTASSSFSTTMYCKAFPAATSSATANLSSTLHSWATVPNIPGNALLSFASRTRSTPFEKPDSMAFASALSLASSTSSNFIFSSIFASSSFREKSLLSVSFLFFTSLLASISAVFMVLSRLSTLELSSSILSLDFSAFFLSVSRFTSESLTDSISLSFSLSKSLLLLLSSSSFSLSLSSSSLKALCLESTSCILSFSRLTLTSSSSTTA